MTVSPRPLSPPRSTLSRDRLWTTGAEMHVTMSKMVAAKRRKVPMWWKKPVDRAMVVVYWVGMPTEMDVGKCEDVIVRWREARVWR